jgi:putative ATP-binding cassette transporter
MRLWTYFTMFATNLLGYIIVGYHVLDNPSILDRLPDGSASFKVKSLISLVAGFASCLQLFPAFLGLFGLLAGLTHRVQGAMVALEASVANKRRLDAMGTQLHENAMRLHHVTIKTPRDDKILFRDMTLNVEPSTAATGAQSLIIMGPSGAGKSSILRVMGGLWTVERGGTVTRPLQIGRGGCFFLPQAPYITRGTLRDQIIYPHTQNEQQVSFVHAIFYHDFA